jgi:macrolide transport system ATP-binding/permease protein
MDKPLIEIRGLYREFPAGDECVQVLKNIDLTIRRGEMVAIMGASGSGKSTLMNIIGCLDRPSRGSYRINGDETASMAPDALAALRREYFGFIFQRYHLLPDLDALGNVEIPSIYSGRPVAERRASAAALLEQLGLHNRQTYRPGQLSGGQQQRVSIARALINGGEVILADEPTGALDSHSGREVLSILQSLHARGHTIIIVTHDASVAANAGRIIEISDGEIRSDTSSEPRPTGAPSQPDEQALNGASLPHHAGSTHFASRLAEAFHMAWRALVSHRLRSFLTMLGIIIGIASVVSVVALGEGSRDRILKDISAMGTNTIDIFPGKDFGDRRAGAVHTLSDRDAVVLAQQNYVDSVSPGLSSTITLRWRNVALSAQLRGVGAQYFQVKGLDIDIGQTFDRYAVSHYAQEVVIDPNTRDKLFGAGVDPLGQVILLNNMPARVIGVTKTQKTAFANSDTLNLWVPYTTMGGRLVGQHYLDSITVRYSDQVPGALAEQEIVRLMTLRHGGKDFHVMNTDSIRQTVESTTATMTLLVSMIAVISLVVGGIGVMNIMLVSVSERTQEIGVRMAVGARQSDIRQQFLIEAVVICLLGGAQGIGLSFLIGVAFSHFSDTFAMTYSTSSIIAAVACSTLIGVAFGYLPARNAARLDPVVALAGE